MKLIYSLVDFILILHFFAEINGLSVIESKLVEKRIHHKNLKQKERKGNNKELKRLWKKNELSYTILGNVAYYNQTSKYLIKEIVKEAFRDWEQHASFKFFEQKYSKQADIKLIFTRDAYNVDPNPDSYNHICAKTFHNNQAHAYFSDHPLHAGEIHINNEILWLESTKPKGEISLKSILLHEVGHVLGLEHSYDRDSIMYPYFYKNNVKSISLSDSFELSFLYRQLCE